MRLWSLHPRYLDRMGLLGLWKEALLAKRLLFGEDTPSSLKRYMHHPQMIRFKNGASINGILTGCTERMYVQAYLLQIYNEGIKRGYKFNRDYIGRFPYDENDEYYRHLCGNIPITTGQLIFELALLRQKVYKRDRGWYEKCLGPKLKWCGTGDSYVPQPLEDIIAEPNPVFKIEWGPKGNWEKSKLDLQGEIK